MGCSSRRDPYVYHYTGHAYVLTTNIGRDSFDLPPIDPLPPSLTDESVTDNERPHRPPQLTLTRPLSSGNGGGGMPITLIPPSPAESRDAEPVHTVRLSHDKECEPEVCKRKKAHLQAPRMRKQQ